MSTSVRAAVAVDGDAPPDRSAPSLAERRSHAPGGRHKRARPGLTPRLTPGLLAGGGLSFVVAVSAVNAFNFVFHIIISRLLGPGYYGALGALLNLIMVMTIPLGAVQLAVTQAVAARRDTVSALGPLTAKAAVVAAGATGVFWGFIPLLDSFLRLTSPVPLIVLGTWIPLAVVTAVIQGALMGELRFRPVAVATFLGGGLIRLLVGTALVFAGFGLIGAVAATVIGQAVSAVILLAAIRREVVLFAADHVRITLRAAMLTISALAGETILTGIDTFLARHYLNPGLAGRYAAAAVVGHIAMFLPGAVVTVVFPRLVAQQGVGPSSRKALAQSLGLVSVLGLAAAVLLAGLPRLAVQALFGASYTSAAAAVGVLSFASAFFGIINLLCYFHLSRRSVVAQASWIGVAAAAVMIALFHGALATIAYSMLIASALVLVLMLVPALGALLRATSAEAARSIQVSELPETELDLTLVVPFYNPGQRLGNHVGELVQTLRHEGVSFEVLAVSDGSTDGSERSLAGLDQVRLLRLPENQGKGAALRLGLMRGKGRYLGFIDGDGDLPARLLHRFVDAVRRQQPDIVLGSKRHPESEVVYPPLRRLYSWGYQQVNRVFLGLPVRDTQTGVKLLRRDVVAAVLPTMLEKRFAFDLELLVAARQLGYRDVAELPVTINERFTSTICLKAVANMLIDTAAVFYRLRFLKHYGPRTDARVTRPESPGHLTHDFMGSTGLVLQEHPI